MDKRKERRAFDRLEFVGAQVLFTKENGISLFNRVYGPVSIKDINMCGACLETEGQINVGDLLFMEIFFPNEEEIRICGNVRWTNDMSKKVIYYSGVQFFQFGWGEHFDSMLYLQRLKDLCDNFYSMKNIPYRRVINPGDLSNNLLDS